MLDHKWSSWFYPKPTGDPGRDRNARTVQFSCFLLASAVSAVAVLNGFDRNPPRQTPPLLFAAVGLIAATVINRAGKWEWAARIAILAVLFTAVLLVFEARDGFRSTAMLVFPMMLLLSVMLLDRTSYVITAGIVLVAVAALGIAEKHARTRAVPGVRSPITYDSIFFTDLNLLVFAVIGSRITRDIHRNVFDLRTSIDRLSAANLELRAIMDAAPAVILVAHDAEGCRVSGNRTAYTVLRQPPGSNLSMATPEGERPKNFRVLRDGVEIPPPELPTQRALLTGQPVRSEWVEVRFEDGTSIDLLGNVEPLLDDSGRPQGAVTVLSDITAGRRAETALRESEQRLRFAQQVANIGTFDWNIQTGVNTWTPELEAMYGLSTGGFPGTQVAWEALLHPDDRARAVQRVTESLETEAPVEEEWRVIWPDGSVRWLAARWQALRNAAGEPIRLMGINIDVTERKHMEEALRASEERLRLAIKATNDAIWDIDLKAGTVSWNHTYSILYGRPESANSWQFWIDRIHPEDRARTVDSFQAALVGGASSWNCEYRFRRVDGEWVHIYDRAYIARDPAGNAWRVIGAMQDLTEQKKAEVALRESEERFRRVFEEGPLGLALVEKDYRFVKVNGALCQMLGYDEAELIQLSFVDITHPDDVRADVEFAEQLFKREVPFYRMQKRYVKKTGEIIWINLTASIILGPDAEPLYGLAMVEDITELKRTQEEALFRQKLESVGTLAGGIAHDFNNLLGAVGAQAELALAQLDAGLSCREELKAIGEVAVRGSEIVRQLMIYAGAESAVVGLVDLSKIVDEMLSLLKVSVTKHAVIRADLDQNLPVIRASAAQIRQIVMNLITNASDAIGDRDGVIRVITRRLTLTGESSPIALPAGDYVELEVSDTGRGMSPQTQAKVFDPFFTTKSAGRGLGLAVVQGIVQSLGGAIHLTSEPDKGATFQILLPCAESRADARGRAMSGDGEFAVPAEHGTVLVVEDEGYLRQPIVKMLRKTGFEVFEAADGTSAIDVLRAIGGRIDAILLDMTIPGASNREIVAEAAKVRPDIRIILTSAYSQEMLEGLMSAPQIRSFIRKPFQLGDLLKTLRSSWSS